MKSKTDLSRAWRLTAAIVITMAGLLILTISQSSYAAKITSGSCAEECFIYLPVIQSPPPSRGIYGNVTFGGQGPIADISLDLRFYDGAVWSTVATVLTDADGMYSFTNVPGLQPGQRYYVRFLNTQVQGYLYTWHTLPITDYQTGEEVAGGDFNISNITLYAPYAGQHTSLPVEFRWGLRGGQVTDSYEVNLFDPDDNDPYFFTNPPLGFVDQYVLNSLPDGFEYGTEYGWNVWVYGPNGNATGDWGISFYYYPVQFYNTNYQNNPAIRQVKTADLMSHLADRGVLSADLDLGK